MGRWIGLEKWTSLNSVAHGRYGYKSQYAVPNPYVKDALQAITYKTQLRAKDIIKKDRRKSRQTFHDIRLFFSF